jgi:hypothetical protein
MINAYPLCWPSGWGRTKISQNSRFKRIQSVSHNRCEHTVFEGVNEVNAELKRLGAKNIIISSNMPVRNDGTPYSNARNPDDSGVAVYFALNGSQQCIPCDKWKSAADNLWAVAKTIEALRGIERWGAKDMVTAAFKGFTALPDYSGDPDRNLTETKRDWFAGDWFADCRDRLEVKDKYKQLIKVLHPDVGGNVREFSDMQEQYNERMILK